MHRRSKLGGDVNVKTWRLDGAERTAVLASFDSGCPALVYFGRGLPDNENLEFLSRISLPTVTGGQLDPVVPLTLLPSAMDGWQGNPGVKVAGVSAPKLTLDSSREGENSIRFAVGGNASIVIEVFLCSETELLKIAVVPNSNTLPWLAAAVPVPQNLHRIIDHSGRWCGEFQRQERRFTVGRHIRESHEGRSGHAHFPGVIFASDTCSESSGECLAVAMSWSGGHRMVVEEVQDGRRQVQFGFGDGQSKASREIWLGHSDAGLNGISQAMQAHVRATGVLAKRDIRRPVHYNCWEAVYFRHSVEELKDIASKAAEIGAERFVLDDGWFKGRNDDTTSLGDWVVDGTKYPEGLARLVEHILSLGMEFGIWFEPEMINVDSDLYRANPDWVLGPVDQPSGRGQFVLDLSKPEVTDYLFDVISAILKRYPVTYIKWDHNRILTGGTPARTEALYSLFERLEAAFPNVEIESCASGGGRTDYGILKHTTRVWLSDSNDALERLRMQHEASLWLPPEVQGSHVGPRVCHTSGRELPMAFRAGVAAQRHMGFEMDPRELTEGEAETLTRYTDWYKEQRHFLFSATHHRLDSDDAEVFAEVFVSDEQTRFVLFVGRAGASKHSAPKPLQVSGLAPNAKYEIELFDSHAIPEVLNRNSGTAGTRHQPIELSGAALLSGAFRTPGTFPNTMLIYTGEARP
ncbi:MAG: alpha-galactosidase [Pseudomonadota bacterium]